MTEPVAPLLSRSGSLADDYAAVDWSATPLGPPEGWSPALRTAVSLCLASHFPIAVCWGPDLAMLYNEAYRPMLGDKHPRALGAPAEQVFAEAWAGVEPVFAAVRETGTATYEEDQALVLDRHGFLEECWFTSSVSRIEDDEGTGGGGGVLTVALETTHQVLVRRRLELLRRLGDLSEGLDLADVSRRVLAAVRSASADLPAVDLLLPGPAGLVAVEPAGELASALSAGHGAAADVVGLAVPLPREDGRLGALLVRRSERQADDEQYRDFLTSVARSVSAALSASVAYQAERGRADAQSALAERLEGLVGVAQRLGAAASEEDVLEVLAAQGPAVLGATGVALGLLVTGGGGGGDAGSGGGGEGLVRSLTALSSSLEAEPATALLGHDRAVPLTHTARTGQALFLPDLPAALALFPTVGPAYARARAEASATVPLRVGERLLGCLGLSWDAPRPFTAQDEELLHGLATLCAQALDRVQAREAEERSALAVRRMSETLQRSLLTRPPRPDGLQIAVRYSPASEQAQVGGDWYDAFVSPDGSTSLVIGDVTGHDRDAAAAMGQVRNLLRATAYAVPASPAAVLRALETTMDGLEVDALATAVLAQVGSAASGPGRGDRVLRWCNAGHLPPVLCHPDGRVELLAPSAPDAMLGLGGLAGTTPAGPGSRLDAEAVLPVGATLLLYTDGLVERRGEHLDDGLERLRDALADLAGLPLEELADRLLERLQHVGPSGPEPGGDDVALLVLRVHPPAAAPARPLRPGEVRLVLPSEPASVARARRATAEACAHEALSALTDTAALLVSEVATNAVRHGSGPVRLAVLPVDGGLRVEVGDDDPGRPEPRPAGEEDEGGRGLALVEALADDWGSAPEGTGKVVWFEVRAQP